MSIKLPVKIILLLGLCQSASLIAVFCVTKLALLQSSDALLESTKGGSRCIAVALLSTLHVTLRLSHKMKD